MTKNENRMRRAHFANGGADTPITPQERFMRSVYAAVDQATTCGLERLRLESGIVPTCTRGCCYCCRQHILTNPAEAHTLAQHVRREWPPDRVEALRRRTLQWHAWDNSRPGRRLSDATPAQTDSALPQPCPLLVADVCSVYPVRPMTCRTHLVVSPAAACRASNDPHAVADPPVVLASVLTAARPFLKAIQDHIETRGLDFSRSIGLLPHGLAIEMKWDFPAGE